MNAQYKQALKAAQEAGKAWQAAKLAYRCQFITDAQFKLASALFTASQEAFDAAYYDESNRECTCNGKSQTAVNEYCAIHNPTNP